MSDLVHGKTSTYSNKGCRCRDCTDAVRDYQRTRYRMRESVIKIKMVDLRILLLRAERAHPLSDDETEISDRLNALVRAAKG